MQQMNTNELKKQINTTLSDLSATLELFDQEKLNRIPFEDSWTGGQVIKHLNLSNNGFADVMNGPAKESNRPVDQNVQGIKDSFLNFNIKMNSPDFVIPEFREYQKDLLVQKLEIIKEKINKIIDE